MPDPRAHIVRTRAAGTCQKCDYTATALPWRIIAVACHYHCRTNQGTCCSTPKHTACVPLNATLEPRFAPRKTCIDNPSSSIATTAVRPRQAIIERSTHRTCRLAFRLAAFFDERARFRSSWVISTPPAKTKTGRANSQSANDNHQV